MRNVASKPDCSAHSTQEEGPVFSLFLLPGGNSWPFLWPACLFFSFEQADLTT